MPGEAVFGVLVVSTPILLGVAFWLLQRVAGGRPSLAALAAGNALLCLALFSLAFAGLEFYYRFVYDTTDVWNRSLVSKRWFDRYWVRNSDDLRDDIDYELGRREGARRITFLGDSYTTAHGVKDVEDRFVNRIRRARPDWDVHALARNGFNTVEEINTLRRWVEKGYELDVVVLVYCHNDIDSHIPEFQKLYRRVDLLPTAMGFLLRQSYAADFFYQRRRYSEIAAESDVDYPRLRMEAYGNQQWDGMASNLDLLVGTARANHAHFAAVTFPWMRQLDARSEAPMHQALAAFWGDRDIPHLDLRDSLQAYDREDLIVSRWDPHPNEIAHALAAEAILEFLDQRVQMRSP